MAQAEQQSGSFLTVLVAFVANVAIALAKSVAALLTGSASMTAEAAHSWADAGNEIFLLIAERRGRRGPDRTHPYGYGRDVYVWSLFAAVGLFTVGAVLSIQHGISELAGGGEATDPLIAYIVLAISFVLEAVSFVRALGQVRRSAGELDVLGSLSLPLTYPSGRWETLTAAMRRDKKSRAGLLRFVLLDGIGRTSILNGPEDHLLFTAYNEIAT